MKAALLLALGWVTVRLWNAYQEAKCAAYQRGYLGRER